jgi:hypothetical protein
MLRAAAAAALLAVALAAVAQAQAAQPRGPVYDEQGRLVQTPYAPAAPKPVLTEQQALLAFTAVPKVKHWLSRYPKASLIKQATYDSTYHDWEAKVWSGKAGQIAGGRVNDLSALLSFSVSLWYFNHGHIFASSSLVYPGLAYLLARTIWIGLRDRPPRTSRPLWPVWVLAAATIFLAGFKIGLNVRASNVIDVGYAGPIGAERIVHGQSPYGNFPVEDDRKPCGPADRNGEIRDRIQTNGRCESANPNGDTYGPVSYLSYIPGYALFGWSGKWDKLRAAHFTSIAFDMLCLVGLGLVGWRFGGVRLGVTLAFAWAAYPFTQYVSNSNSNDAIMPAFLILGFWLSTSHWARGLFAGLAGWTKFAALIVVPLWATYPEVRWSRRTRRSVLLYVAGFAIATAASFWVLLLEPDPLHAARVFWDRTIPTQIDRHSPFSLWDWGQYHAAGIPDLSWIQKVLEVALVAGAGVLAFLPRKKTPLQLAAFTGALLIGFEIVLTHWFYLYLPWFFGFVAYAVLAAEPRRAEAPVVSTDEHQARELVPAG